MGIALRLMPAALGLLLIAAHFLRAGLPLLSGTLLALGVLLAVRRPWSGRVLQVTLALACLEWLRTLAVLSRVRLAEGAPWLRMALILAAVALWTAWSAWLLESPHSRRHFRRPPRP